MNSLTNKTYKQTLGKSQRIKHKKTMEALFKTGKKLKKYPLKLVYLELQDELLKPNDTLKFAVSVPKRLFKNAVDRNLLKRRIKEAYRISIENLSQQLLNKQKQLALMFIYGSNIKENQKKIEKEVKLLLNILAEKY